jgi:hypothetical protein
VSTQNVFQNTRRQKRVRGPFFLLRLFLLWFLSSHLIHHLGEDGRRRALARPVQADQGRRRPDG